MVIAGETSSPSRPAPVSVPAPEPARPPRADAHLRPGPAHLLGALPEPALARWMARAAIFAHPARYEPFGLAVLEAALAGCALVLGDVDSLRELWEGAAVFVPPSDAAALEAELRALAGDPARRAALAARSRGRALDLGPGRMARGYLDLYRDLAAPRAAGATP